MDREQRTANFIALAKEKHGDKFSYENFDYVNAKTKSTILCSVHGPFEQTPDKHLRSKHGCPSCWAIVKQDRVGFNVSHKEPEKLPLYEYLERVEIPANHSLDTSKFEGLTKGSVVLYCPEFGPKTYVPRSLLLSKYTCSQCARIQRNLTKTLDFDQYIVKAQKVHNHKYSYPDQEYVNTQSMININCLKHGLFKKRASKHLSGQGCYQCQLDELRKTVFLGGYSKEFFQRHPEKKDCPAYIYYLKIDNLYKIGITTTSVARRVSSLKGTSKAKKIVMLQEHKCSLEKAFILEQRLLSQWEHKRVFRRWSTELFNIDILDEKQLKDLL